MTGLSAFAELCLTLGNEMQDAIWGCQSAYKVWQQLKADNAPADVISHYGLKMKTIPNRIGKESKHARVPEQNNGDRQ